MQKFFYRVNKDFFLNFRKRVQNRFMGNYIRSDSKFLKSLMEELYQLFNKLKGRISSRRDIPAPDEYPDSNKFNRLVSGISTDLVKLYKAQDLINDDVKNVLKFNSIERKRTINNFASVQQRVFTVYSEAKQDQMGTTEIPTGTPFEDPTNLSDASIDVAIDQNRKTLRLAKINPDEDRIVKPIDFPNVTCYISDPVDNLYPNNKTLAVGSHWKQSMTDKHFIDYSSESDTKKYKKMMIDNETNRGVGLCEFEGVFLNKFKRYGWYFANIFIDTIKNEIGEDLNRDPEILYVDFKHSLQGKYSSSIATSSPSIKNFKLIIPFDINNTPLTNEIHIMFSQKDLPPKINWENSFAYDNSSGSRVPILDGGEANDGKNICIIKNYIVPSRLELDINYKQSPWEDIPFYMKWYVYSASIGYSLPTSVDNNVQLNLNKIYNIFVDSEANLDREKQRALNVLLNEGE